MGAVGHTGSLMAGKIGGFQCLEKAGGCASIQRSARSLSAPWQVGTESCAQGGIPDSGQHQEEALRHGRGKDRGPCLWAWAADGGLGRSWDLCSAQTPLPSPEEVLVLSSWILPLWGRGFSCLHNCCQQEIWLLQPQAPLQELRRALWAPVVPHSTYKQDMESGSSLQCSAG